MTDNAANNKTQREMIVGLTVSAAVQETKLDTVIDTLEKHCASEEKWRSAMNGRMRGVEIGQAQHEERIKSALDGIKHTIRNATGLNALYASVVAAVAGIFGSKS